MCKGSVQRACGMFKKKIRGSHSDTPSCPHLPLSLPILIPSVHRHPSPVLTSRPFPENRHFLPIKSFNFIRLSRISLVYLYIVWVIEKQYTDLKILRALQFWSPSFATLRSTLEQFLLHHPIKSAHLFDEIHLHLCRTGRTSDS